MGLGGVGVEGVFVGIGVRGFGGSVGWGGLGWGLRGVEDLGVGVWGVFEWGGDWELKRGGGEEGLMLGVWGRGGCDAGGLWGGEVGVGVQGSWGVWGKGGFGIEGLFGSGGVTVPSAGVGPMSHIPP